MTETPTPTSGPDITHKSMQAMASGFASDEIFEKWDRLEDIYLQETSWHSVSLLIPAEKKEVFDTNIISFLWGVVEDWKVPQNSWSHRLIQTWEEKDVDGKWYIPIVVNLDWLVEQWDKLSLYNYFEQNSWNIFEEQKKREEVQPQEIDSVLNKVLSNKFTIDESKERIDSFSGDFRFLSNFQKCDIVYKWVHYSSVEHAYQAQKFINEIVENNTINIDTLLSKIENRTRMKEKIRSYFGNIDTVDPSEIMHTLSLTAWDTKILAQAMQSHIDTWRNDKKLRVMTELVYDKFLNNPDLQRQLLETWDNQLIEWNNRDDTYRWVSEWIWSNYLWKILMEVRDRLRKEATDDLSS